MKIAQIGGAGHAFYAYDAIKRHGFDFAALDLSGYRMGSLNIHLDEKK